ETGVAGGSNSDPRTLSLHDPVQNMPHSSRVVSGCHEHDGLELMLGTPLRKKLGFIFGSNGESRKLHKIAHTKPSQLANLPCGRILIGEPSADELVVLSTWRVAENRDSRRDSAFQEIGRFKCPLTGRIERYDDNVGGRHRLIHDKDPSGGS